MPKLYFPPIESADESGLLAFGGDLSVDSLLSAYTQGVFPWPISEEFPLAWFCPDPRGVVQPAQVHIPSRLKRSLQKSPFHMKMNQQFFSVITNCALAKNRKQNGKASNETWITEDIIKAYFQLHKAGHAYSLEVYNQSNELVGGIYGVVIGHYITGESMFHLESNASKFALLSLCDILKQENIPLLDTQMLTPVVKSLGGEEVQRAQFIEEIKTLMAKTPPARLLSRF